MIYYSWAKIERLHDRKSSILARVKYNCYRIGVKTESITERSQPMIRVMVADDHPHVAIALRTLLQETADIRLVAETRQGSEVLALVQQHRPHVLFLDLVMGPAFDALSTVRTLLRNDSALRICILSAFMEPVYVRDLLQAGVCGYILKDDDYVSQIERIVRHLLLDEPYLSEQAYAGLAAATRMNNDRQLLTAPREDPAFGSARLAESTNW